MSTPLILAIQSKGTAILLIAWLYTKSVYEKKIKIIEAEKDELNKKIAVLEAEVSDLKENLSAKEDELAKLKSKSNKE
jgi:predicted  nucleic acid-binding Zn-ribbon protein